MTTIFGKDIEHRIAFVGLANAGKTTLLKSFKGENDIVSGPTMGLNAETINLGDLEVVAFDIGGQKAFLPLWKPIVQKSDAVIYVFDSADDNNVSLANEWFRKTVDWAGKDTSFLFLANKQDLSSARSLEDIIDLLGIQEVMELKPRAFGVYPCSALTGEGVNEPFVWLSEQIENQVKRKADYNKLRNFLQRSKDSEKLEE